MDYNLKIIKQVNIGFYCDVTAGNGGIRAAIIYISLFLLIHCLVYKMTENWKKKLIIPQAQDYILKWLDPSDQLKIFNLLMI